METATQVVQNLKLTLEQSGNVSEILRFDSISSDLRLKNEGAARQFAIEGRKAYLRRF